MSDLGYIKAKPGGPADNGRGFLTPLGAQELNMSRGEVAQGRRQLVGKKLARAILYCHEEKGFNSKVILRGLEEQLTRKEKDLYPGLYPRSGCER